MAEITIPSPEPTVDTLPYWQAIERGELMIRKCLDCGEAHYYPRPICPFCFSADTEWLTCSGLGAIYSFTVMRRGPPYAVAFVKLAEGPCMMTNLVDCDFDALAIGQTVRLSFLPTEGGAKVPVFTPPVG